jgi:cell division protein FtsQ
MLVLVTVVLLTAAAGWVALASPMFALRKVTIDGVPRATAQQVAARAGLGPALSAGRSLLRIDPSAVARRIEQLPPVAHVQVSRHWPHDIVITVIARRPVATVQESAGSWVLLDMSGVAFATVHAQPTGLVPVKVDAPLAGAGKARVSAALAVYRALPARLRAEVAGLDAPSPESVSFHLKDGREVVWGSPADSSRKVVVLRALLHRRAVRYDVSAPDVAVTS